MIQSIIGLAIFAALMAGGMFAVHTLREQGRDECRAEHQEAARMAELRSRERADTATKKFLHDKQELHARERAIAPQVASAVARDTGSCIDDGMRELINADIRQGRGANESSGTVSTSTKP